MKDSRYVGWRRRDFLGAASVMLSGGALARLAEAIAPPAVRNRQAVAGQGAVSFVEQQLERLCALAGSAYPEYTTAGKWRFVGHASWVAGYFPGMLWLMYGHTKDPVWRERARRWAEPIAAIRNADRRNFGVMFMPSFVAGYRLTGDGSYRQFALDAASSLARLYNPHGGYIQYAASGKDEGVLIIDNLIDLSLLYWAAKEIGQPKYSEIATSHALVTLNATVNADGSSLQPVELDPRTGDKIAALPRQGASPESCWSRGQAWALYSLPEIYKYTRHERFLKAAERMANWWIDHVPDDYIPYWDFDAPQVAATPRDSSAAALTAGGLWELSKLVKEKAHAERYRGMAIKTLDSLTERYLATGAARENGRILVRATTWKSRGLGVDESLIVGDYYYLELLLKVMKEQPAARRK
ncbi:MAG: glycoside hydrolase family 88 protein [Acidobacteria bacterium]|nr:glycoside hydrolase family 88 protein [Acidobacteriota bacterium]